MRIIIISCLFLFVCSAFAQKQNVKYFDVIISLSASDIDTKVEQIKTFISNDTTGVVYEGYCKSQKCVILKANNVKFSSPDSVFNYFRLHIGDAILANKDYTIKEFYKMCTFASEQEYHYFKTTYR